MLCREMLTFSTPPSSADLHQQNGQDALLEQDLKCNYTIAFWELQQSDRRMTVPFQSICPLGMHMDGSNI